MPRNRPVHHFWPLQVQSLRLMKEHEVGLYAHCLSCDGRFKVNLDLLIRAYGPQYNLLNKTGICPARDCGGKTTFMVQTGQGVPFRPYKD